MRNLQCGTYNEQLVLNKQITLKAKSSKNKPVICLQNESSNCNSSSDAVIVCSADCKIESIQIMHSTLPSLVVCGGSNLVINDCEVSDNGGIIVLTGGHLNGKKCNVHNIIGNAVSVYDGTFFDIENWNIHNADCGFVATGKDGVIQIYQTMIYENKLGIEFNFTGFANIESCGLYSNKKIIVWIKIAEKKKSLLGALWKLKNKK